MNVAIKVIVAVLFLAVVGSCLGIVYSKHMSRKLFVQLQQLEAGRDQADIQWGRLQLEQSTWATHGRVERIARNKLQMVQPESDSVVILR